MKGIVFSFLIAGRDPPVPSWSWPVSMPEHWKLGRAAVGVPVRDSVRTKASDDPQAAEQAEAKTKAQTEAHTEVQTEEWTGRPQLYLQMNTSKVMR